ncbi:MAG: hypothetical protein Q9186_001439 [Xanthomendoza sp. 1 TL-2023]
MRVFTTKLRSFTVAVTVIGSLIGATGIATIIGSILQCLPIAYNWDKSTQGRCINEVDFARYTAIPNVVTGFAMLILPLPMAWRLNINVTQKIALTATFLHGIIGFVASVTRLAILCETTGTMDKNTISWTIWTLVEPANYVIVACLPTLRPILTRILPAKFFFFTYRSTSRPYSIVSISWPKGRGDRKVSTDMAGIKGASHMIEPWNGSRTGPPDMEANIVRFHRENIGEKAGRETARDINASPGGVAVEYPPLPAFGGTSPQGYSAYAAARVPDTEVDSGVGF